MGAPGERAEHSIGDVQKAAVKPSPTNKVPTEPGKFHSGASAPSPDLIADGIGMMRQSACAPGLNTQRVVTARVTTKRMKIIPLTRKRMHDSVRSLYYVTDRNDMFRPAGLLVPAGHGNFDMRISKWTQ